MTPFRSRLISGAAITVLLPSAAIGGPSAGPGTVVVAAAQPDPVAAAEKAVSEARAQLRKAMATGQGIRDARAALAKAEKALDQAKLAALAGAPSEAHGKAPSP